MIKKYSILIFFLMSISSFSQVPSEEIKIFTLSDFDLKGKVKKCLVGKKYGKEEYQFDSIGRLQKSITRFNDMDYDLVLYKYQRAELIEKRSESYRNNIFDPTISIGHFFTIDTTSNKKITEKIISYDNQFLEQYIYQYNAKDILESITTITENGVDLTAITQEVSEGKKVTNFKENKEIIKSTTITNKIAKDSSVSKIVLRKEYLHGAPFRGVEETYDPLGLLVEKKEFGYDETSKDLHVVAQNSYLYSNSGILSEQVIKRGKQVTKSTFIYQNDEKGNWIREIIIPENTYTTRKIEYYAVKDQVEATL